MWLLWYLCAHGHTTVTVEIIDAFKSHRIINFTTQGSAIKAKTTIKLLSIIHISVYKINVHIEYQVHEKYFVSSS